MTAPNPPAVTETLAALTRLRVAWTYLDLMLEPGPMSRTRTAPSPARAAQLRRLHRQERTDRLLLAADGGVPSGPLPAPLRVPVLDARQLAVTTVVAVAWRAASVLRHDAAYRYWPVVTTTGEQFTAAADYLAVTVPRLDVPLVDEAGRDLDRTDRVARAAAGVDRDERRMDAACPACGRRSIWVDVGSPDQSQWTARCTREECRCRGVDCACRIWGRVPGRRHVWPRGEFDTLARVVLA